VRRADSQFGPFLMFRLGYFAGCIPIPLLGPAHTHSRTTFVRLLSNDMGFKSPGAHCAGYYRSVVSLRRNYNLVRTHESDGQETGGSGDSGLFEPRVSESYSECPGSQHRIQSEASLFDFL